MADRSGGAIVKPIWMKQAEEAKLKSESETAAAAKAAFEATFSAVDKAKIPVVDDSDSDGDEDSLSRKPPGPLDPSKCSAAGAGISGGEAGSPSTFVVVAKDSDARRITGGGAHLRVKVSPGVGVGGSDLDGMVKDQGDGTYTVTYAVPKRGNYMVHAELNGRPITGSPFPVFFSQGSAIGASTGYSALSSSYPNKVNQTMPNMPNYAGSVSGAFPGLLGAIPGIVPGSNGGVVLQGIGASLGEICGEFLNGRCGKTDCKLGHPPQNLLMSALAATTTMGTLSNAPMAPSAAAMAAAQAIVAAKAIEAYAAQMQVQNKSSAGSSGSLDKGGKADALKRTLQVSNLNPLLTVDQLKQLFSFSGTVVDCVITDSKHLAYIEYSKPEDATAALAMDNMDVGGRPLNVEMAKSLPSKSAGIDSSIPLMMQQAVAMQQMQFQQALAMQQTIVSQQAATRAATMKSATDMASARAAEISMKLKEDGLGNDDDKEDERSTRTHRRSKSRSRSPTKYRRSRRSRSFSPPYRYVRDRSPPRSHHSNIGTERRIYRDVRNTKGGRRERDGHHSQFSSISWRDRSVSPRLRKSSRAGSTSPKHHRESRSPRRKRSPGAGSRLPRHQGEGRSSHHSRHPISGSAETRHRSKENENVEKSGKPKHRRSRSRSTDARHHSQDAKKSGRPKHQRSRSRSTDRSHRSNDIEDTKKSEKPNRRRSRSGSADGRQYSDDRILRKSENWNSMHSDDAKKSGRPKHRRSRSRSTDIRHRSNDIEDTKKSEKSNRRRSRSGSADGRQYSDDRILRKSENRNSMHSDDKDAKMSEKTKQEEHNQPIYRTRDGSVEGARDAKDSRKSGEYRIADSSAVSHKRSYILTDDETFKKPRLDSERIGSVIKDHMETGDEKSSEFSPTLKLEERSWMRGDDCIRTESQDLSRHRKPKANYRKHYATDYAAHERDLISHESTHSRDGKRSSHNSRSSHHSSSRSHRSSRDLEERSYRKDHIELDKSREEPLDTREIDGAIGHPRPSNEMLDRSLSVLSLQSAEAGFQSDSKEMPAGEDRPSDKTESIANKLEQDFLKIDEVINGPDETHDMALDSSKLVSDVSNPESTHAEIQRHSKNAEEHEMLGFVDRLSDKTESMTNKLDYIVCGFGELEQDSNGDYNMRPHNRPEDSIVINYMKHEDAKLDSEILKSCNSIEHEACDSRDSTSAKDDRQPNAADIMDTYHDHTDQGSVYFENEEISMEADVMISNMKSVNDEMNIYSSEVNGRTVGSENLKSEGTPIIECRKLAHTDDQEYNGCRSTDTEVTPTWKADSVASDECCINKKSGLEKNVMNEYIFLFER